jgi:queuine tRNA-ribosyltransferase
VLETAHGPIATPVFMPVGTQATVKALSPTELRDLRAGCVLANTYHLALRPGAEIVERLGGLHGFMGWDGPILTDSGGFQVWSLADLREITADGVRFRSHLDGAVIHFSPESVVATQERLGADIIMQLDVCSEYPAAPGTLADAVATTQAWAVRSQAAQRRPDQLLFGIVQGGPDLGLRAEAARALAGLDLAGYAIGGLSVGEPKAATYAAISAAVAELPADRPRYLMGVGAPEDLLAAVERGVDLFDCTLPSRMARGGGILTPAGRVNLRNARYRRDPAPLVPGCACQVCGRYSRAAVHWLLYEAPALAARLATYHNLKFLCDLLRQARVAVAQGCFPEFRDGFLAEWVPADPGVGKADRQRWRAALQRRLGQEQPSQTTQAGSG